MSQSPSSDGFDDMSFTLTEEDCKIIDALSVAAPIPQPKKPSPLDEFRPSGRLSVTDLVSPFWCEVQFEYGLRQRRHKKPERRPASFKTAQGKQISVDTAQAVRNNITIERGKAVHVELEREVHPEVIQIRPKTAEERWALRMLNMLVGFSALKCGGICREFPVFGYQHGHLIIGIIDEIKAVWLQASLPGSPQQGQTRLEQHFQGMRVTRSKSRQTNSKVLQLKMSDTKTRRTNTLPPHSDTLSARLQLMLYRNMLEGLVSQKPPFNFEHLCADQKLDSSQKFSDSFIAAASLLIVANDIDSKAGVICSLGELFDLWRTALGGTEGERIEVSTELRLVYRRQFMEQRKLVIPLKQQDEALSSTATSEVVIGENSTILEGQGDHTPGAQELDSRKDVIGTKKFQYSDQFLEQHMSSMFDWWEGRREPEGVKHENIHRCHTCEYRDGCEWLESRNPFQN